MSPRCAIDPQTKHRDGKQGQSGREICSLASLPFLGVEAADAAELHGMEDERTLLTEEPLLDQATLCAAGTPMLGGIPVVPARITSRVFSIWSRRRTMSCVSLAARVGDSDPIPSSSRTKALACTSATSWSTRLVCPKLGRDEKPGPKRLSAYEGVPSEAPGLSGLPVGRQGAKSACHHPLPEGRGKSLLVLRRI